MLLRYFSQSRFMDLFVFKSFIVFKIPLMEHTVKNIIDVKIIDNNLVIRAKIYRKPNPNTFLLTATGGNDRLASTTSNVL